MILLKNGDYTLEKDPDHFTYAVFRRVWNKCGTTSYWEQLSKWYSYKKYALDKYKKLSGG